MFSWLAGMGELIHIYRPTYVSLGLGLGIGTELYWFRLDWTGLD